MEWPSTNLQYDIDDRVVSNKILAVLFCLAERVPSGARRHSAFRSVTTGAAVALKPRLSRSNEVEICTAVQAVPWPSTVVHSSVLHVQCILYMSYAYCPIPEEEMDVSAPLITFLF